MPWHLLLTTDMSEAALTEKVQDVGLGWGGRLGVGSPH